MEQSGKPVPEQTDQKAAEKKMFGNRLKRIVLLMLLTLTVTGCEKKVIAVSGIIGDNGEIEDYIEIHELERKEPVQKETVGEYSCVVMIPEEYHESKDIPGLYTHERAPVEASNIYYTVSAGEDAFISETMTKKEYEEAVKNAYSAAGDPKDIKIESFEKVVVEGVPTFKIKSSFPREEKQIQQLIYLVMADHVYTVVYSQVSDDEMMPDFEMENGVIRLVEAS